MSDYQAKYAVSMMARMLEVSTSGYSAWHKREPSKRAREDAVLQQQIKTIHANSRSSYGAPRVHAELKDQGVNVGRKRVARLMRQAGLAGICRRRNGTTKRNPKARPAPDLVKRDFSAQKPDQLWVADIKYVPTRAGFLYLAVVLEALNMAIWQRRPKRVIHHSDQGTQYTALAFGKRCKEAGIRPSMGSVGDCFDNALCESFFATLECELIERCHFDNPPEARLAIFEFIEGFYNPLRRHSALNYDSPCSFECKLATPTAILSTLTG